MLREQLEHLIRAAGAITGSRRILVIGSQSILGQFPIGAPPRALLSMEADLVPLDAPERSDLVTGSLGELSPFHDAFGYFADGVDVATAVLPEGWSERLVSVENPNIGGYVGLCLEVHDLLISKYVAGRDKDHEFCRAVVGAGLVSEQVLLERLACTAVSEDQRDLIQQRIAIDARHAATLGREDPR
jgi:hypothetical protein